MKHEKQILFLKECLHYSDAAERQKLEESISRLQRNERCVRQAMSLMLVQAALALVGLGYCAVFLAEPRDLSGLMSHFVFRLFCALVLVSAICIPVFLSVVSRYRRKLDQQKEECLRLVAELLEARLGKPVPILNLKGAVEEQEVECAVSSCDGELIPSAARMDRADQPGGAARMG